MSLLARYKGHRSSLSLLQPRDITKSPMQKVFLSYKNPCLEPLDTIEMQSKGGNKNAVNTDTIPNADDDLPVANQEANHEDLKIEKPRDLPDVSSANFNEILQEHVKVCKTMCDFGSDTFDLEAKTIKTNSMNAIISAISTQEAFDKLGDDNYKLIQEIVDVHVFRYSAPIAKKYLFSDDLVTITEPSLPHLLLAYQILNLFIDFDAKLDIHFLRKLVNRFSVPDVAERDELVKSVIKWTTKHDAKADVKKIMCDVLSNYLCKTCTPHMVYPSLLVLKELLDYPNDRKIFDYYLMPMLGAPHISTFNKELFALIEGFCDNDATLLIPAIKGLMYHWPKTRSSKLIIFLNEMTKLLSKVKARDFKELRVPAFKLYGASACSPNYKVAEAAYSVWTKLPLEPLIMDSAKYVFPLVYYPISNSLKTHWSSSVVDTMNSTLEAMNKIDSFLFQELCRSKNVPEEKDLVRLWAIVSRTAMHQDRDLNLAAKLAEIQKTFTKPVHQQQQQKPGANLNASGKRVIQPQLQNGRNSRSGKH